MSTQHLKALKLVDEELEAWGDYERSESWLEQVPEAITSDKDPDCPAHDLWLAVVELEKFYPKQRLPKLSGALDAWSRLLGYSRQHGSEPRDVQVGLAVTNAKILRDWVRKEIEWVRAEIQAENLGHSASEKPEYQAESKVESASTKKAKRTTQKGEARIKLIAALIKHHKYEDDGCLNLEPIGNNELARLAGVDQSSASDFFKKHYGGHGQYWARCADAPGLALSLKALNGDITPLFLFGAKPPGEVERNQE